MNLAAHYDAMRAEASRQLANGAVELDPLLDAPHDTRRGLTLLARPPAAITAAIEAVLADFQRVEPTQYYYPASDIHLTVLSIISCYPGFTLAAIEPAAYQAAGRTLARASRPFGLRYAGLTASAGGLMVQGFPQGAGLQQLRGRCFRRLGFRSLSTSATACKRPIPRLFAFARRWLTRPGCWRSSKSMSAMRLAHLR